MKKFIMSLFDKQGLIDTTTIHAESRLEAHGTAKAIISHQGLYRIKGVRYNLRILKVDD